MNRFLVVATVKFLALKNTDFSPMKNTSQNFHLYSMQPLSADLTICSKKFEVNFLPTKNLKNGPQKLLIIGPDLFFHSPAHSPELIFHIMKSRDQTSVQLSVEYIHINFVTFILFFDVGKQ